MPCGDAWWCPCFTPIPPLPAFFGVYVPGGKRVVRVVQGVGCGLVGHVDVDWGGACSVRYLTNKLGPNDGLYLESINLRLDPILSRSSTLVVLDK